MQKGATFYCMLSRPNEVNFRVKTFVNNFGAPLLLYCLHYNVGRIDLPDSPRITFFL